MLITPLWVFLTGCFCAHLLVSYHILHGLAQGFDFLFIALELLSSPDQPTLGSNFSLTCMTNKSPNVSFSSDNRTICSMFGTDSCSTYDCIKPFVPTCNSTLYSVTIPYWFDIDQFHGSSWKCQDFTGQFSNTIKLYVTGRCKTHFIHSKGIYK